MLSREENELLTRVGPGTPMGATLRRYWMPALLSWELPEADCPPVRVRLLGEDLVAFRDSTGRGGLLDEVGPPRLGSLWLGRNEDGGLRCVYHGWKFDAHGQCTDQMNEPEQFAHKVRATAYPTWEKGGVIWAYMGPAGHMPPAPDFEYLSAGDERRGVTRVVQDCNWLRSLEGGIDTSHAPILHRRIQAASAAFGHHPNNPQVRGGSPTLDLDPTDYGYRYFGVRSLGAGQVYVRGYHFVMPFTQIRPMQVGRGAGAGKTQISGHHWVPVDDATCMVWNFTYSFGADTLTEDEKLERDSGNGPEHVDWNNGFRGRATRANNWQIDRRVQKYETFTGIDGVNTQDRAVQESMGVVVDRTREHLGPADRAVITARQLLLRSVRQVQKGGDPLGANDSYWRVRAMEKILPKARDWREVVIPEMTQERVPTPVQVE